MATPWPILSHSFWDTLSHLMMLIVPFKVTLPSGHHKFIITMVPVEDREDTVDYRKHSGI